MNKRIKSLCIYIAKIISPIFYNKKYLKGRFFEEYNGGWYWAVKGILWQKIFRVNSHIPWPCSPNIVINNHENIHFHIDDINNFQTFGCYFQNFAGEIFIGKGSYVAPNVGLITCNHDPNDPDKHLEAKNIVLGKKCWIGMNSTILPGVVLGDNTIVGAGSVVTKSFTDGYCIIAGNPARIIKKLDSI